MSDERAAQGRRPARPFGVTAIVVLLVCSALLFTATGLTAVGLELSGVRLGERLSMSGLEFYGAFLVPVVLEGTADLVAAIGLLRLRRWAWVLAMLIVGYRMANNLWLYASGGDAAELEMLLDVVMVFYLNQRDVQRAFGHGYQPNRRQDVPVQRAR